MIDEQFLTEKQLAKRWQVSRAIVNRWKREQRIPIAVEAPGKPARWKLADVEKHERDLMAVRKMAGKMRDVVTQVDVTPDMRRLARVGGRALEDSHVPVHVRATLVEVLTKALARKTPTKVVENAKVIAALHDEWREAAINGKATDR